MELWNPPQMSSELRRRTSTAGAFRRWVHSLSWDDLQQSSAFHLEVGEFELIQEMLRKSLPLMTPVHPRAIPFQPASVQGKDYVEPTFRRKHPRRLLHFIPKISEEEQMFAMLSGKAKTLKKRSRAKAKAKHMTEFDVIARQFRLPGGDVMSELVCTEQRIADAQLCRGTVLETTFNDESQILCKFVHKHGDFLRLLRISSRGQFSLVSPMPERGRMNESHLTSWFDPCDRWFSVSMYLASRFEATLWNAFRRKQSGLSKVLLENQSFPFHLLADHTLQTLYESSMSRALLILLKGARTLLATNYRLRDGPIWYILNEVATPTIPTQHTPKDSQSRLQLVEDLWVAPLDEVANDDVRRAVREQTRILYAEHMQKTLLRDVECTSDDTFEIKNTKTRRRKKAKTRIKSSMAESKSVRIKKGESCGDQILSTSVSPDSVYEEGKPYTLELPLAIQSTPSATNRERNRAKVLVLSLIDDIVDTVFEEVGKHEQCSASTRTQQSMILTSQHICEDGFHVVGSKGKAKNQKAAETLVRHGRSKATSNDSSDVKTYQRDDAGSLAVPATEDAGTINQSQPQPRFYDRDFFQPIQQPSTTLTGQPLVDSYMCIPDHVSSISKNQVSCSAEECPPEYNVLPIDMFQGTGNFLSATWEMPGYCLVDDWGRVRSFADRDESILTQFFDSQKSAATPTGEDEIMASSTAASIASSSKNDDNTTVDNSFDGFRDEVQQTTAGQEPRGVASSRELPEHSDEELRVPTEVFSTTPTPSEEELSESEKSDFHSPIPPSTPPPTLSPILVSLSDLSVMQRTTLDNLMIPSARSLTSDPTDFNQSSLDGNLKPALQTSRSRDDLRTAHSSESYEEFQGKASRRAEALPPRQVNLTPAKTRDDHDIKDKATIRRSIDALSSYRDVVSRVGTSRDDHDIKLGGREMPRRASSYKAVAERSAFSRERKPSVILQSNGSSYFPFELISTERRNRRKLGSRSETGTDDCQILPDIRNSRSEEADNYTITKDGSTTITSGVSNRAESEELITMREERNSYRDRCLTLGAEVGKLKNLLAAQKSMVTKNGLYESYQEHQNLGQFHNGPVTHAFHIAQRPGILAAMSDAGYRGEHESLASEDDFVSKVMPLDSLRQLPSGITAADSENSLDHNSNHNIANGTIGFRHAKETNFSVSLHGMQSRLAMDIVRFVESNDSQLRKQSAKKRAAMERMTRLVKTVWPRAQINLYGSHVTNLAVPTSDLDFVVSLPAVHKNAVAVAPGALEGRNAINETSQKLLARRLKGESWIDQRSMKLIERTVVPVIKVSTKDTKAKTLNLDISFDAPGHHGLEAIHMVTSVMEEFPMLRSLIVVLKQFLVERSLLEAYTGGLSSYCLFLIVTRYLQEQDQAGTADVGSLLMGFLDFYGNHFDPRSTGISVRHRQYFARPNNFAPARSQARPAMWNSLASAAPEAPISSASFHRRNSFSDRGSADAIPRTPNRSSQNAIYPVPASNSYGVREVTVQAPLPPAFVSGADHSTSFDNGMPYTFDPLFVEDPLSDGNNVGRNAFRIVQVQRAFSDAHRALVAALEWDMNSCGGELQDASEFPLLKCLLQSEDVVFDL